MVAPAVQPRLEIKLPNAPAFVAGVPYDVTVTATDPAGNVLSGYRGSVSFSGCGCCTLPADYTFTAEDAGVHVFGRSLTLQAGTVTVTVTDVADTTSASETVTAEAQADVHLTSFEASSATAGAGQAVRLAWATSGGPTAIALQPGGLDVTAVTSGDVTPFLTRPVGAAASQVVYRLAATNAQTVGERFALSSVKAQASTTAWSVAALANGGYAVAGQLVATTTFGTGEPNETVVSGGVATCGFVARYGSDGTLAWVRTVTSNLYADALAVAATPDGGLVVVGNFASTATLGVGEPTETHLAIAEINDDWVTAGFVARYDQNGALTWARQFGSTAGEQATSVAASSDGSVAVTGLILGDTTFGAGEAHETTLAGNLDGTLFVARFAPNGSLLWAKAAGGAASSMGQNVVPLPDGGLGLAGVFCSTLVLGTGEAHETTLMAGWNYAIVVARLAADGSLAWARATVPSSMDYPSGLVAHADGSLTLSGNFYGSTKLGAGEPGETILTAVGNQDALLARFAPDGTLSWARPAGGAGYDAVAGVVGCPDGTVIVGGTVRTSEAILGELDGHTLTVAPAGPSPAIFLARFDADGTLLGGQAVGNLETTAGPLLLAGSEDSARIHVVGSFAGAAVLGSCDHVATFASAASTAFFAGTFAPQNFGFVTIRFAE